MTRFARNVQFQIKDGKTPDFLKILNTDVLPMLKKQDGFRDELMLLSGSRGMGISLWDERKHAEQYGTSVYPEVMKKLTPVLEGTPKVEMYEVGATTLTH